MTKTELARLRKERGELRKALANLCNAISPGGLLTDMHLDQIADTYGGHVADCYQQAHEALADKGGER